MPVLCGESLTLRKCIDAPLKSRWVIVHKCGRYAKGPTAVFPSFPPLENLSCCHCVRGRVREVELPSLSCRHQEMRTSEWLQLTLQILVLKLDRESHIGCAVIYNAYYGDGHAYLYWTKHHVVSPRMTLDARSSDSQQH
jgi:hypothetical protein